MREDEAMTLHLASTDDANALLERDPLALLLGMLLDQQIPMEKAFTSPRVLADRLGTDRLDAGADRRATTRRDAARASSAPRPRCTASPARWPSARRQLCQALVDALRRRRGQAVWAGAATAARLVRRMSALPGLR